MNKYQQAKRLLVFQLKLGADALRDLILSPVSVVCVLLDMLKGHDDTNSHYQKLMRFGRRTDSLINLFEHKQSQEPLDAQELDIDQLADKFEAAVKREYQEQRLLKKVLTKRQQEPPDQVEDKQS